MVIISDPSGNVTPQREIIHRQSADVKSVRLEDAAMPSALVPSDSEYAHASFCAEFARLAGARFDLRQAEPLDRLFLRELFEEVQGEALRRAGVDPAGLARGQLSALQFESQCASYLATYPRAHHYIALRCPERRAVGRILIDWTSNDEATVGIDLAVLPSARGGAVGLHLLRAWVAACDRLKRRARLHVMPDNPARRLYRRLGFAETDPWAFPLPMVRLPRARE